MPTQPTDPLRKVTLNLYEADCATLAHHYGRGWTTEVRDRINDHARLIRQSAGSAWPAKRTLGDLDD